MAGSPFSVLAVTAAAAVWSSCLVAASVAASAHGVIDQLLTIRTCGKPNIQNIMNNVTARPGQTATFKCQVDMSCIVSYIEWYHEMDNGTEKLIKTASSSGDPHVHIVKQVDSADEGLYTCIAGNVLGQATASAYLEVNAATSTLSASSPLSLLLAAACVILVSSSSSSWSPFPLRVGEGSINSPPLRSYSSPGRQRDENSHKCYTAFTQLFSGAAAGNEEQDDLLLCDASNSNDVPTTTLNINNDFSSAKY